jgi:hypothetical protein
MVKQQFCNAAERVAGYVSASVRCRCEFLPRCTKELTDAGELRDECQFKQTFPLPLLQVANFDEANTGCLHRFRITMPRCPSRSP